MAPVSIYEVIVTREDDAWLADVPSVPGAHTFARSLRGLTVTYQVDDPAVQDAAAVGRERRATRELEDKLLAHTSDAVTALAREGYSVRDAAALLDLTAGRVSQLLNA